MICGPHPKTESISTTNHTKTNSIDHQTPNKLISARTRSISIPRTKNKSLSIRTLKPSQFDPYSEINLSSIPHINQVKFDPNTKTRSFSTPTQKPSQFRSPLTKQVNFDPHTKNNFSSIQILKPSNFRPPHKNQVIFDPHTKTKSIPIPALKSSQVRSLL